MPSESRRGPKGGTVEVRENLLIAGAELVEEFGVNDFPLRLVAERAGVTRAMVTYYFSSKSDFLAELLAWGIDPILQRMKALPDQTPRAFQEAIESVLLELAERPWVAVLAVRTLYLGPQARNLFLATTAPQILEMLGRRRSPLPTDESYDQLLDALPIIACVIFPILARRPIASAFDRQLDSDFFGAYAARLSELFET